MGKENLPPTAHSAEVNHCSSNDSDVSETPSRHSWEKDGGMPICRVCQCVESDRRGDAALGFLGITPRSPERSDGDMNNLNLQSDLSHAKNPGRDPKFIEIISPDGEVYVCATDLEMGHHQDSLLELGCSCKNDLALVHYACALKWFVNHGSTVCEICGQVAKNISTTDFKTVINSLKEYERLRERTASGEPNSVPLHMGMTVDPDALAAIRRQRLSEISLWFNPHHNSIINNNQNNIAPQVVSEQPSTIVNQDNGSGPSENPATKWAVEENCKKWSSYTSGWCLRLDSRGLLPLFCTNQNQVRTGTILGHPLCFLVSGIWDLGIKDTRCTHNMKSFRRYCSCLANVDAHTQHEVIRKILQLPSQCRCAHTT
ncbi:hypothetical protein EUGRSUZ_H05084 [Eucalyptus grandis]|uniref:Uncharacterized protein n=2 Tax=Eucalyptus grandis TaxID=71139 RepID=A0ACC3JZ24_EUCGR|nr:hypothetical protein EUGRSUZ_H05084 [Eucalyptus grandis]